MHLLHQLILFTALVFLKCKILLKKGYWDVCGTPQSIGGTCTLWMNNSATTGFFFPLHNNLQQRHREQLQQHLNHVNRPATTLLPCAK